MAVFAIIAQPHVNTPKLEGAIAVAFPNDHLKLGPMEWLVAVKSKTAKEVSDQVGITDGSNGSAIILETATYYGRANNNIWGWLRTKLEATSSG